MKRLFSTTGLILPFLICSCGSNQAPTVFKPTAVEPITVELTVNAKALSAKEVSVEGKTNLPDGFVFTVSAYRCYIGSDSKPQGSIMYWEYPWEVKVPVEGGMFASQIRVQTKAELRAILQKAVATGALQEPGLAQAPIEDAVSIEVLGTPRAQGPEILAKIGGENTTSLIGPMTRLTDFGFRVVDYETRLKMK